MSGEVDKQRIYDALNEAYFSAEPHEKEVIEHLPDLLRREGVKTFVDVGASLGQYTLVADRSIRGGTVWAVEADPVRFEELERNCRRWEAESANRIVAVEAAAADRDGEASFFVTDSARSGGLFRHELGGPETHWREVTARAVTLDTLLGGRRADFVKVDVEGGELRVLRGAKGILRAGRARFLVELHGWTDPEGQSNPDEVHAFMASFGYRAVPFYGRLLFVKEPRLKVLRRLLPQLVFAACRRLRGYASRMKAALLRVLRRPGRSAP
jgi:FkbM family methyltransferase